jgi:RNA polymerase sigma-70 factor, ECF subfamily
VSVFPHSEVFWAKLPRAASLRASSAIEEKLALKLGQAQAARPSLSVDMPGFVAHWATQLSQSADPEAEFERLHLADLYLAFACGQGDEKALRQFHTEYLPAAVSTVRGVDSSEAFIDEVTQQLMERILVSVDGVPRILEYGGRGSLEHWLRAAALRLALNARRSSHRAPDQLAQQSQTDVAAPSTDLQLALLQARFGPEFGSALQGAMRELSPQERSLLRLHFLEGLSLNQIGAVYQVNKSTISRRMSRARENLLEKTRGRLEVRLKLQPSELESLMHLLGPGLQLSLASALVSHPTPRP